VAAGLAKSNSDARRLVRDGGVRITGRRVTEGDRIGPDDVRHGRFVLLARGRKAYALLDLQKPPV
jgi:tyrosyl-tRNA synthetase